MSAGFFIAKEYRGLLRLLYVLLIALLPFAGFCFITLGLPEGADGVGKFRSHRVISVTSAHQIISQPALILFHYPISLSHVPLRVPTLTGACRLILGGASSGMMVQSHDPGREPDGQSGGERDARCQKMSAILAQTDQLGEIVAMDCDRTAPSPCSQNRKPAVMAGLFADKCGKTA